MNVTYPYLGQILSLASAIVWAFAVILFRKSGETVHPIALNLFKNILTIILLLPTMMLFKVSLITPIPLRIYIIFFVSGILGIATADTFFFMSLNKIGASLVAIAACTYSPFIILLSYIFLRENLTILQIFGVVLIIFAVIMTTRIKLSWHLTRRDLLLGILYALLSTSTTSVSIILIKPLLKQTPLLWAIEMRLIGGFISLLIISLLLPIRRIIFTSLNNVRGIGYSISGTLVGTYLTLIIWLAGMKYTLASIASALNQTSSVFVFIFAAFLLKEKITQLKVFAIIVAIIGVFLVFLG